MAGSSTSAGPRSGSGTSRTTSPGRSLRLAGSDRIYTHKCDEPLKTSQLALPKEACDAVYATTGYESSARNLGGVTLTSDNVFGDDGGIFQIATVSGDVTKGYTAALAVGI